MKIGKGLKPILFILFCEPKDILAVDTILSKSKTLNDARYDLCGNNAPSLLSIGPDSHLSDCLFAWKVDRLALIKIYSDQLGIDRRLEENRASHPLE